MKTLLMLGVVSLCCVITFSGFKKTEQKVNTVDVGISVSDTARSLAFYTEVLGMKRISAWHCSAEMAAASNANSGRAFDVIDLNLDCEGYGLKYKLNKTAGNVYPDDTDRSASDYYGFEKLGTAYLTINVKSVDPFIERLKANNIKYAMVTLPNGYRVVLLHDPDGILIEISSL